VSFDDSVGKVLPDWKDERTAALTFRNCFHHLSGLRGHVSHGGLFHPYLDNALFVEDEVFTRPRTHFFYNGDDLDLVVKALELLTCQSMFRLFYENMQKPFGEQVTQFDMGFGDQFTAPYLAKVGQMLLQNGRYGKYRIFSPGFAASLRPRRAAEFAPELD